MHHLNMLFVFWIHSSFDDFCYVTLWCELLSVMIDTAFNVWLQTKPVLYVHVGTLIVNSSQLHDVLFSFLFNLCCYKYCVKAFMVNTGLTYHNPDVWISCSNHTVDIISANYVLKASMFFKCI